MDYHTDEFNLNPEILEKIIKSNILLYCIVLILALRIIGAAMSVNFPYNVFFANITKITLENLVNQTRQSAGLPTLTENEKLSQAAMLKAENMVQNQYFNHVSPTGITPWYWFSQAGYNYKYAGENLAVGFYESEEVYQAWLNSPTHKENIMNPNYKEVGTAVLKGFGDGNAIVVVQLFGSQKTQAAKTTQTPPAKATNVASQQAVETKTETETKIDETAQVQEKPAETQAVAQEQQKTNPAVLSQSVEISEAVSTATGNIKSKMINYILYSYNDLLANVVYGITLVVIGIMLTIIFLNPGLGLGRQLVYRSFLLVVLLSVAVLVNKDIVVSLIPHQIII